MSIVDVTCAVIIRNGYFLTAKRGGQMSRAGKWEFPGGKVEKDETADLCILREIREELNIVIRIKKRLMPVVHHYPDISIRLIPYITEIEYGDIKLREHSEIKWVRKEGLKHLDWAPADIPVVKQILNSDIFY